LNAANEAAVHAFLNRKIGFRDIARVVERTLEILPDRALADLEGVYALDREAREVAARLVGSRASAVAV
jgi:1-deoxy-D-xylulose-5-phosphate reductoisomerase